jgi:hypothetical protein
LSASQPPLSAVPVRRCPKKTAGEPRQQAERYRRLKRPFGDPAAVRAICNQAGEFEMTTSGAGQKVAMWNSGLPPSGIWKMRGHAASDDVPESYPA